MNGWQKGLEGVNNQEGNSGSSNTINTMEKMQTQITALGTMQHVWETPALSNKSLDTAWEPLQHHQPSQSVLSTTCPMLCDSLSQNQDLPWCKHPYCPHPLSPLLHGRSILCLQWHTSCHADCLLVWAQSVLWLVQDLRPQSYHQSHAYHTWLAHLRFNP